MGSEVLKGWECPDHQRPDDEQGRGRVVRVQE